MNMSQKKFKLFTLLLALLLVMTTVLAACGSGSTQSSGTATGNGGTSGQASGSVAAGGGEVEKSVTIGTHPQGLAQYTIGGVFAGLISKYTNISATASPFAGPSAWMPLLNAG